MRRDRIQIYLLITLLVNLLNFLKEWQDETLSELFEETLVLFPSVFLVMYSVFFIQKKIVATRCYKSYITNTPNLLFYSFWVVIVTLKTVGISIFITFISNIFFNTDVDEPFFDIVFWVCIVASSFIILFVYFIEYFFKSQEEKQDIKIKLSQYETEKSIAKYLALKKQLNPHFLFNSFNSLLGLISIDKDKAESFLQELSNVYRYNLTQSEQVVVSLKKELQMIQSYVYLQKIRFGDTIEFFNEIDSDQMNLLLPPMTLELLVENAIKHNIIEKHTPLKITIYTKEDYVYIVNQFQPRNNDVYNENSLGIGLKNLKAQLALISNRKPVFKVIDGNYMAQIPLIKPDIDI